MLRGRMPRMANRSGADFCPTGILYYFPPGAAGGADGLAGAGEAGESVLC